VQNWCGVSTFKVFFQKNAEIISKKWGRNSAESIKRRNAGFYNSEYSDNQENLGNQQGESYLSAMFQVYSEAAKSGISPLCIVTKNPTKDGTLKRLDLDTVAILQKSGYRIYDYHRAVLVSKSNQKTLRGEIKQNISGRVSFFKRLSFQKGNVIAEHEDIIK